MNTKKMLLAVLPLVTATGFVAVTRVNAAPPSNTNNVTICHRTHSITNPYVRITVDQNSVSNGNSKHGGGAHDLWATTVYTSKPNPNVYNSAKTYPANDKKWGDIIAFTDVSGNPLTGSAANVAGLNNTGLGADIFNGTNGQAGKCGTMNPRDYYEVERAAGVPDADVKADMNELASVDSQFTSAQSACGGSFTGCNPATLGTTSISIATTTTVAGSSSNSAGSSSSGSTTPTTAPPALSAGKGGLIVKIWIDSNRNGSKNSTEKYFSGIKVTIEGPDGTKTGTTDSNGNVTFSDLTVGKWSVKSVLANSSYTKVFDSDGTVNWAATATVVEGQYAKERFAAAKAASLPATGSTSSNSLAIEALLMLGAGVAILASRRRLTH